MHYINYYIQHCVYFLDEKVMVNYTDDDSDLGVLEWSRGF